jgi:hypothetical protein
MLKKSYSLFSGETHPIFSALESFEEFISKPEQDKQRLIKNREDIIDTLLKVIGILMDAVYKERRGYSLARLSYSNKA